MMAPEAGVAAGAVMKAWRRAASVINCASPSYLDGQAKRALVVKRRSILASHLNGIFS